MTPRRTHVVTSAIACALLLAVAGCGPSVAKLQEAKDVPALVEIAEKPGQDFTKVSDAVDAIGEIGTPEAVDVLIGWVTGDDDSLRIAAIPALGVTGDPKGVPALVSRIEAIDPSDTHAQELDLRALVEALGGIDDPAAAKALLAQVDAESAKIIGDEYLGRALAGQGDDIVASIKKRITNDDPDIALPCGVALYLLNADDKEAVGKLLHSKATQRAWAGIFTDGSPSDFERDLTFALDKFGDRALASRMLNSENDKLESAARDWAGRHGFMVQEIMTFGTAE